MPAGRMDRAAYKDLHKLSREELLEMLLAQTRESERLRAELDDANKRLASRDIQVREAGSIAEASLRLNHVFEAAQAAADQYVANVKRTCRG